MYQVTIECAPFCVWLHSANVTCNFSPYANQAVKLCFSQLLSLIKSGIVQLSAVINQSALFYGRSYRCNSEINRHFSLSSVCRRLFLD